MSDEEAAVEERDAEEPTAEEAARDEADEGERDDADEGERDDAGEAAPDDGDEAERDDADEGERADADEGERVDADEGERDDAEETARDDADEAERDDAEEAERDDADEAERDDADEAERDDADEAERDDADEAERDDAEEEAVDEAEEAAADEGEEATEEPLEEEAAEDEEEAVAEAAAEEDEAGDEEEEEEEEEEEYARVLQSHGIPREERQHFYESFSLVEAGRGYVAGRDTFELLHVLGQNPGSEEEALELLEAEGLSVDSRLTFEEFAAFAAKRYRPKAAVADDLLASFQAFDKDGSGYLEYDELYRAVFQIGSRSLEEEAKEDFDMVVRLADTNRDGRIDYGEFCRLVTMGVDELRRLLEE